MNGRLSTALEVAGLLRQAEAAGGFAAVIRRGDPDRGELVVQISGRGAPHAVLERRLAADYAYRWTLVGDENADLAALLRDRPRIDPDFWLIELDIPDAERFVAEMTATG